MPNDFNVLARRQGGAGRGAGRRPPGTREGIRGFGPRAPGPPGNCARPGFRPEGRAESTAMDTLTPHSPVSAEARGRVRQFLAEVERDAAELERWVAKVPLALLDGSKWKGTTGSRRGIDRLCHQMPRPPDFRQDRVVLWRYVSPLAAIPGDDARRRQAGVSVKAVIAMHRRPAQRGEIFGLILTEHALARALDRSAFVIDLWAAIIAAHNALLAVRVEEGRAILTLPQVELPSPHGFFLARPRTVGSAASPVAIARTWIHRDQGNDLQVSNADAWRALMRPL